VQGFGFVKNAIIDQHFIIRKRFNRLLSVVLEHPKLIGIGIDESTAILYKPDKTFEVIGERNVLVIDATKSTGISLNKIDLFAADNITLHLLKAGQIFDTVNRKLIK
jgi:cyanophycinase